MSAITGKITAEELLQMPRNGVRYELVDGELRVHEPAGHAHGRIAIRIAVALSTHVLAHDLGEVYAAETGFLISTNPDTVRAPDAAFVSRQRVEEISDIKGYFPGAPDLAVEVISPADIYGDVEEKALAWLESGTGMVVILNPRHQTATIYKSLNEITILTEHDLLEGGDVVPGWRVVVGELFR